MNQQESESRKYYEQTDLVAPSNAIRKETIDVEDNESLISVNPYAVESPVPSFNLSTVSKYVWYELDESSLPLLATVDLASRHIYEKLGRLPGPLRYGLGEFRIDQHRTVSFEVIPAFGEVGYSEVTVYPPGSASPPDLVDKGNSPSPLLRFLQLTDKGVPVPRMLQEFDDSSDDPEVERALAGRDLVDSTDSFGKKSEVFSEAISLAAEPPAVWTCFNGGNDVFSSTYCQSKDIWFCDNESWKDLTRSSGSRRRKVSHSRVAACGPSFYTIVEHQYRVYNAWKAKYEWLTVQYEDGSFQQELPPGWVKYWKHVGGRKRRRKIRIWTSQPAYFRSWTAFYN